MTRPILSLCVLGLAVACGASFAGPEEGSAGAGGSNSGGSSSGASAGGLDGGRGGGSSSGGSGNGTSTGGSGVVEPPIGVGGQPGIGAGGDGVVGSSGTMGFAGEPVIGAAGSGVVGGNRCESLLADYVDEVDKARECDPELEQNGTEQCSPEWTFEVPCGCPVPYNLLAENVDKINELLVEIQDNGCQIPLCDPACSVLTGTCEGEPGSGRHICQ